MAGQANDTEKLPWLEPYRDPRPAPEPVRKGRAKLKAVEPAAPVEPPQSPTRGVPLAVWLAAGVAVVGMAASGGYWIGNRRAPVAPAASPTVTIPVAKVDPIPMPEVDEALDEPTAAVVPSRSHAARRAVVHRQPARHVVRRAPVRTAPSRPTAGPPMPKAMSVRFIRQGSAAAPGSVVDLGRYPSTKLADSAFKTTVGRYPYLGRYNRVVVPMPPVYGQPRLYALQLGATSAREARDLCANLVSIGRPCVVR